MALVHPNESSIAERCLKEVIPERLPSAIISAVCAVISANLVGSIHTIHEMIVHINEIGYLKALEWLVPKCLFNPFVLLVGLFLSRETVVEASTSVVINRTIWASFQAS